MSRSAQLLLQAQDLDHCFCCALRGLLADVRCSVLALREPARDNACAVWVDVHFHLVEHRSGQRGAPQRLQTLRDKGRLRHEHKELTSAPKPESKGRVHMSSFQRQKRYGVCERYHARTGPQRA